MSEESVEEPREQRVRAGEVELAVFEWRRARRGQGPSLLLVHATGFHARCWDPVVAHLGERHVLAVDLRGHGRSEKTEIRHWDVFGRDLAALAEALDLRGAVGVGHSMGGHALVDAAAAQPGRFQRLVLIDPVIASPDQYGSGGWTIEALGGRQHPTAKRKRHFESPQEMFERFRNRAPYNVFREDALRAYCVHGLLPVDGGMGGEGGEGFALACPPEIESSIYMTSRTNKAVHDSIRALDIPVLILRAKLPPPHRGVMDFSSSPTSPDLAGEFRHARDLHFPDHTHFLPMEIPERIAELIREEWEAAER